MDSEEDTEDNTDEDTEEITDEDTEPETEDETDRRKWVEIEEVTEGEITMNELIIPVKHEDLRMESTKFLDPKGDPPKDRVRMWKAIIHSWVPCNCIQ